MNAHTEVDHVAPCRPASRRWIHSFHGRSILATSTVSLLAWLVSAVLLMVDAGREHHELVDAELREGASTVLTGLPLPSLSQSSPTVFEVPMDPVRKDARSLELSEFNFQAWDPQRHLISRTSTTPTEPLNESFLPGFTSTTIGGERWRVFTLDNSKRGVQIQVGKRLSLRALAARREALDGLRDLLFLLFGLTVAQAVAILWTAAPLRRMQQQVLARRPGDTSSLPTQQVPAEVLPLVESFNHLLTRAEAARLAQQRFVADAAHELRTPLAVLRLQAQAALRSPVHEREPALQRLESGINRASRVVEQLLALAHIEAHPGATTSQVVRVDMLCHEALELMASQAARHRVHLHAHLEPLEVRTQSELLLIALRNLVDNAIRYSVSGGQVSLIVRKEPGGIALVVRDSGPGLDAAQKLLAVQPFVRLHEGPETGSGLGLAIVTKVCDHIGADLVLHDSPTPPGLDAVILLPG